MVVAVHHTTFFKFDAVYGTFDFDDLQRRKSFLFAIFQFLQGFEEKFLLIVLVISENISYLVIQLGFSSELLVDFKFIEFLPVVEGI